MDLLIDTQALVWTISEDRRFTANMRSAIESEANRIFVSAVTAFEFHDLERRGRLPPEALLERVVERLRAVVLDYPGEAWRLVSQLPLHHLDPVDRMLIAHAIYADLTLVTADETIRRYPVRTLW
ncbi:type II toxin-antitoxin system VapC family toxin [Sphingomonas sp. M1-B02]|uniref:type II toxin-antitoxin system VapC family toxin n=1 Tax=Sphingomonas sp. M1-B02 TaxID=3114300 RepID=UPI00223FA566|nr:type II toxin-antitoxin system VapC family toxin [Sphingomonas sp. S6-11]UZK67144.1 type II toxin-antitoxin system VapC family toxin [Sphingomonas sp. S6-11]